MKNKDKKRFKCTCAYDGTDFNGWQSQREGLGIQDHLEGVLAQILGEKVRIHGSGRTDAGVHANGQVFHFDGDWKHGTEALVRALNSKLNSDIQIRGIREVSDAFHARFTVKKKRYVYFLYIGYGLPTKSRYTWSLGTKEIDVEKMKKAAGIFVGKHNFSGFGAMSRGNDGGDPVKEIFRSEIIVRGREIKFVTEGSGYLYKMVRRMVGGIVDVGLGKLTLGELKLFLGNDGPEKRICTAPARGLFLDRVFYW